MSAPEVEVEVVRSSRARRVSVRVDRVTSVVRVTLPRDPRKQQEKLPEAA